MRLAIVTTHPIQYYAPLFKLLAAQVEVMVFYTWGQKSIAKHDPGFGRVIKWDIDLLSGYPYSWAENTAADAGSHHFNGIINPRLISDIKNWQPDTLLVYGWAYHSHLRVLNHFKGKVEVLFRGDSTLLDEKAGFKSLLRSVYLTWVYKHIDYALYTGTRNKAYFKKYGVKEDQLIFSPHAIDNQRFGFPRTVEVQELRQQLNIKENDLVLLFAGKLEEKKDPQLLLDAFKHITLAGVHLVFVGDGALRAALEREAASAPNIHFIKFQNQDNMPAVYQLCDLFCLPSRGPGESWGLAVNEAMACGKAVLVSDKAGCAADLVRPGTNGYCHQAGSLTDLLKNLKLLIDAGKYNLALMGNESKKIIADWTFQIQVKNIVNYDDRDQETV